MINRLLAKLLMTLAWPFLAIVFLVFIAVLFIIVWPAIPFGRPVREGSSWKWKIGS